MFCGRRYWISLLCSFWNSKNLGFFLLCLNKHRTSLPIFTCTIKYASSHCFCVRTCCTWKSGIPTTLYKRLIKSRQIPFVLPLQSSNFPTLEGHWSDYGEGSNTEQQPQQPGEHQWPVRKKQSTFVSQGLRTQVTVHTGHPHVGCAFHVLAYYPFKAAVGSVIMCFEI